MPKCNHPRLVPIEYQAGRRCYSGNTMYIDYMSNIINAHILRVTKLYCPDCNSIIEISFTEEEPKE